VKKEFFARSTQRHGKEEERIFCTKLTKAQRKKQRNNFLNEAQEDSKSENYRDFSF
jgi:hypothetical protein